MRYILLFFTFSLSLYGTIAYIGSGGDVDIYDVTNPDSVYIISSFDGVIDECPKSVTDIWLYRDYLYVATTRDQSAEYNMYPGGVNIFDASDSINPVLVSRVYTGGDVRNIYLQGDLLYVVSKDTRVWDPHTVYQGSLFVYDISDPSSPQLLDAVEPPGSPMDVYVNGEYVYVGTGDSLLIYTFPPIGVEEDDSLEVDITGEYVVVKGYSGGIRVYDVVGRDMKVEYSFTGERYRVYTGDLSSGVYFVYAGGRVYRFLKVGSYKSVSGIRSLSKQDYSLVRVGGIAMDGNIINGFGDYLYICPDSASDFRSVDISNPANPVKKGYVANCSGCIEIVDTFAYVLIDWDALAVIDISQPDSPVRIDKLQIQKVSKSVGWLICTKGDKLYTADFYNGLRIWDISSPGNPVCIYAGNPDYSGKCIEVR